MNRLASVRLLLAAALLAACAPAPVTAPTPTPTPTPDPAAAPQPLVREFRGLWVATVGNIDWPSRADLPAAQQQAELVSILDRAAAAGFNAIVFHVRPAGDAVYRSALEPWGRMLTGTQGQDPGWDPLEVAVREAHARGLELHAWINPYRAGNLSDTARLAPTHLARTRPELVVRYGTQLWMNPGEPEVQAHTLAVVRDILTRYDVDGLHLDDYFYPYPQYDAANRRIDFPDSATFARTGLTMPRDDWRRQNVDRFVERLFREVHEVKPQVKLGISPFGIWRPGNPTGITGLDAYAELYADARKWLREGWVDYMAPQLYWPIASTGQPFGPLLGWWVEQNVKGRHVWPGLASYRLYEGTPRYTTDEITGQVRIARERTAADGHLLYNTTTTLTRNGGEVAAALARDVYQQRAVSPAYPWLDATPPGAPTIARTGTTLRLTPASTADAVRWWFVQWRSNGRWTARTWFNTGLPITLPAAPDSVLVEALDGAWNASARVGGR